MAYLSSGYNPYAIALELGVETHFYFSDTPAVQKDTGGRVRGSGSPLSSQFDPPGMKTLFYEYMEWE